MELNRLDGGLDIFISYSGEPTITLRGEVDFRNMERVKRAIWSVAERGQASINVDLKELVFMDSTGLGALIDAAKAILPNGGSVKLVSPSTQLVKVLTGSGLTDVLKCPESGEQVSTTTCPVEVEARDVVEYEFPARAEMISHIRARVADFACSMPFTQEEIDDIKLAVGEASSNALRHGANPDWCRVGVRIERHLDCIKVFISDKGCGFDPASVCPPDLGDLTEGGRGIMFMRALMDEVKFHCTDPGMQVELTKLTRPVKS